ncbi:MAG: D-2-hydroxyacid dehydrogenase [Verrucomicrobia bacterium]|nr:D-2-hydroxyacid dehydrogenase [Verrucomicrobiota bacterium]MBI3868172.1 D-2-hydroxyacid dehydrogenase [Verrucomicrobiota bacterium]
MRIVILDGYTLNPGDLGWEGFQALGETTVHDRTPPTEIVARARDAEAVLTNKVPLSRQALEALPKLRYIGVLATGYNIVDVAAAKERGIVVANVPAYGTRSVAQMTLALILELALRVGDHAQSTRQGEWSRCPDFCYWRSPLVELEGRTLGLVGLGRIGRAVAELGAAFGMKVIALTRSAPSAAAGPTTAPDLRALLESSDVVSLHCPLTDSTRQLINRESLSWMKRDAWLINTSRGPLVEEMALAEALNEGRLGAAALDVLSVEPPPADHPLLSARNCWITPHIAWASAAARRRLLGTAVDNLRAFCQGRAQNTVH